MRQSLLNSPTLSKVPYATRRTEKGQLLQVVASRGNKYTAVSSSLYSGLGYTSSSYRSAHVAFGTITSLTLAFLNQYDATAAVRTDGTNAIRVRCSIVAADGGTVSGAKQRQYFNGTRTATIDVGGLLWVRDIPVYIPKGSVFYIETYVEVDAGGYWPIGLATNLAAGGAGYGIDAIGSGVTSDTTEGSNVTSGGADLTGSSGSTLVTAKFDQAYGPYEILGTLLEGSQPCVGFFGDSINAGSLDFSMEMGYPHRAMIGTGIAFCRLGRGGEVTSQVLTNWSRDVRTHFIKYLTHAVCAHGRNDFTASTATATVQANAIALWTLLHTTYGIKVWQATITPHTTSTDNWATLANQSIILPTTDNQHRVDFNNWVRDGAPMLNGVAVATGSNAAGTVRAGQSGHPLQGYIELADTVESSRDSGLWAVDRVRTLAGCAVASVANSVAQRTVTTTDTVTAADVGEYVVIPGIGSAGATLTTRITKILSANSFYIWDTASTVASGQTATLGAATKDGTHPGPKRHSLMAVPVAALSAQFAVI